MRALLVTLAVVVGLLAPTVAGAQPSPESDVGVQVIGGQPADPGEDPWMAALVLTEEYIANPFAGLVCGASFISPDTLLTAAHCVDGWWTSELSIVAGSHNLLPAETERLPIRNIRIHPQLDWRTGMYDFAVIQLRHAPRTFTPTPIDLVAPDDAALWEVGDLARFTGWGVDERGQPISTLMEADDPVVADDDCEERYTTDLFRGETMVCVGEVGPGGGTSSPCYGDSGGPLTVLDGARPVLIGIVLGGIRCGDENYPAIFSEVAAAVPFLQPYLDPDGVPQAVRDLSAARRGPQGRAIAASWRAPEFDGGRGIISHEVTVRWSSRRGPVRRDFTIGGAAREVRIGQLPPNRLIRVTVAARNPLGLGPAATVEVPPPAPRRAASRRPGGWSGP